MTYVAKDLKLYVTKGVAYRAIQTMKDNLKSIEIILEEGTLSEPWSYKPETDPRYQELILTLRRILSKNGMLCFQDRPVSDLFFMQRYMQYLEQTNLLQYILQDLTDKEIRNLQSLVQRAEKLSKIPGLDASSILKDAEKPILDEDLKTIKVLMDEYNAFMWRKPV